MMIDWTMDEVKEICNAAQLPLNIPLIDERMKEYHIKYAGAHRYYAVLHDLVKALKPGVVVELGGWTGTSAACMAAANPDSLVITIDHHSDPGDDVNKMRMLEACELFPNMKYLQGCTIEKVQLQKPGTINLLPTVTELVDGKGIDLLFIDSWHQADYAQADWDAYSKLLNPGALVICDDICGGGTHGDAIYGMLEFWESLPGLDKWLTGDFHGDYHQGFLKHIKDKL